MPQESKPSIFKWASTGTVVSMDAVKQALGWTAEKPMFQKMNWLFQVITQHLSHVNAYGIGVWDAATDYGVGGMTLHNGVKYECLQTPCVNKDPSTQTAYWAPFGSIRGEVRSFAMSAAPAGWLKCNGAAVSRTTYAALFALIGTTYGSGDGSTTFKLPDLRGEFVRGWDDGKGTDAGRVVGSSQSSQNLAHTHDISLDKGENDVGGSGSDLRYLGTPEVTITTASSGGSESRPRNIALLYCIKY